MQFSDAFNKVCRENGLTILEKPFLFYSLVSDLIGGSILDSRLLKAYYLLDNTLNLYKTFIDNGLAKSRKIIFKTYIENEYDFTSSELTECVKPISLLLFEDDYYKLQKTKPIKEKAENKTLCIKNKPSISPIVVVPKQSKFVDDEVKNIFINVDKTRRLRIIQNNNSELVLYKVENDGILTRCNVAIRNGTANVYIKDSSEYLLSIPSKRYNSIEIKSYNAGSIIIGNSFTKDCIQTKKVRILTFSSGVSLYMNASDVDINASGDVLINGTYSKVDIISKFGNVEGDISLNKRSKKIRLNVRSVHKGIILKLRNLNGEIFKKYFKELKPKKSFFKSFMIGEKGYEFNLGSMKGLILINEENKVN